MIDRLIGFAEAVPRNVRFAIYNLVGPFLCELIVVKAARLAR